MNISETSAAQEPPVAGEPVAARAARPGLTAKLLADQAALQNDLEQAQELAADFRRVASDKTNEVAHLKSFLEQLKSDLLRYEKHIAELRAERHDLANEVMKLTGFQMQAKKFSEECGRLRVENAALHEQLAAKPAGGGDKRIDDLVRVVEELRRTIEKRGGPAARVEDRTDRSVKEDFIDISFGS